MTLPEQSGFELGDDLLMTEQTTQVLGSTAVFNLLSSEQQQYAQSATDSMVETLGLIRNQVELVVEENPQHGHRAVAIDASPNGQFVGLYRDILARREAEPDWYTVLVGDERIDLLAGCTEHAYRAMVEAARNRGEKYLPDSLALNQHNGHVWTATMMTGDPLPEPGKIMIGSSSGGPKVNFVAHPINRGGKSFRVRPAIVVGKLEE